MPKNANKMAENRIKMPLKRIKTARKRIKKWKIGDYIRQFSIVTGGVLLTLWLTTKIADSAKQREVRQAMQLVALELRDNRKIVCEYERLYNEEKRVAERLQKHGFSTAGIPADTAELYRRCVTNSLGKPYRFLTDALEMCKTTGIASHVADKQVIIDLLRTYNIIGTFDNAMGLYYEQRSKTLVPHQMGEKHRRVDDTLGERFAAILADRTVQGWLASIPYAYDDAYFARHAAKIDVMIAELEQRYGSIR